MGYLVFRGRFMNVSFCRFFTAHPFYQDYFRLFKGRPLEELQTCPKLRAHCAAVMFAISSIVSNLDDVECLVELVKKNATNHHARNIGGKQFDVSHVHVGLKKAGIFYKKNQG